VSTVDKKVRIGVALAPPTDVSAWLIEGAAFDAAGVDALWLDLEERPELDPNVLAAALAAVTYRCVLVLPHSSEDERAWNTLATVSRGRTVARDDADGWEPVEMPAGRAAWREALSGAKERGVQGLVLTADPRLLDLLRNPDEDIDRRDLQLAAG
jgi:hypothetical protein